MGRPKSPYRNELKTRVTDRTFEGVRRYMAANGCASEARAVAELLDWALFGMVGSVPRLLADCRHELGHCGTETPA